MRLIILILLFFCSLSYAEDLFLEHNFGEVSNNQILKYEIQLKEKPKNVLLLCDCLKADIYKEKIDNNIVYILKIEFDPKEYQGDVQEDVIIVSSDKKTHLKLRAFVKKGEI